MASDGPLDVVVAGAGVAGLETLLALHALAGERVRLTLVDPGAEFVERPWSAAEAFQLAEARRHPLAGIAAAAGARVVTDAAAGVSPAARELRLRSGAAVRYDKLVLALGARREPALEHAITFATGGGCEEMQNVLADVRAGRALRLAFVVPSGACWAVPLYELAVMTAAEMPSDGEVLLVTPELRPMAAFGPRASEDVAELLAGAGVRFMGDAHAEVRRGAISVCPGGWRCAVDATVTVPRLRGPRLAGVWDYADGYVPTDDQGRVLGVENVFAAGDMTTFPIKHGGLAIAQAEAVAAAIAAEAGADVEAQPFRPVLRAMLIAGPSARRFIRYGGPGAVPESESADGPLWWPPTKVAGGHLARYLWEHDPAAVACISGRRCRTRPCSAASRR